MTEVDLVLKNYRCFPSSCPARFSVRSGFTAFVGVNNSGKSSLLKFFEIEARFPRHAGEVPPAVGSQ